MEPRKPQEINWDHLRAFLRSPYQIKQVPVKMNKAQIAQFLAELRGVQEDMIEELVRRKEAAGFPEANAVINRIRRL